MLLTFQLHTRALPKADWAACNVADQADLESRCLVCFPIATGFGGLTLRKGRMHFFFFLNLSGSLLSVCRGNKYTAGTHVRKPFTRTCLFNAKTSSTHPPSPPCFQDC